MSHCIWKYVGYFQIFFYIDLSHNSTVIKEQTLYWNHTRFQYLCVNVLRLTLFIDWLCATLWTAVCQAPLFMGFSGQDYWSRLPFTSLGDLPKSGTEPRCPAMQANSLPSELLSRIISLDLTNSYWLRALVQLFSKLKPIRRDIPPYNLLRLSSLISHSLSGCQKVMSRNLWLYKEFEWIQKCSQIFFDGPFFEPRKEKPVIWSVKNWTEGKPS